MTDLRQAHDTARAIAAAALGRDPGPMTTAESSSHHVYVGSDVVVKIVDATGHSRLTREIALAPHLPPGLTAPLLSSGTHRLGTRDVRYACARRGGATDGTRHHLLTFHYVWPRIRLVRSRYGHIAVWCPGSGKK